MHRACPRWPRTGLNFCPVASVRKLFADTAPLASVPFRRLWIASIVTGVGSQLTVVTIPAQIYAITKSSADVGLAGVFGLVPLIVFGLWGGALADNMNRRTLLVITTSGLIASSAALWVQAALGLNNVWLLFGIFAIQQAFLAVNQPTRSAILPKLIPLEKLPAANALNSTAMTIGAIAGPLVGGALMPVLGFSWLYLFDTITMCTTLFAVVMLPSLPPVGAVVGTPGLRSVIEGFAYLKGNRVLLMSFVVDLVAMIFGMPRALFPQIANQSFGGPAEGGIQFGLLNVGMAIGAVLGGIMSGWISRVTRQGITVIGAILVYAVGIAVFGVAVFIAPSAAVPMLVVSVAMLAVAGAADMASAAFRGAMILTAAEDEVRGRLQGVYLVVVAGGPRIADVAHGYVAEAIGTGWTTLGGALLVIVVILLLAVLVPEFTRYTTKPVGQALR